MPVRDQVDAELALRRLDRRIDLAGRHVIALGVELEVMDQRFHRALHLAALRRHDLVVERGDRPPARFRQQLGAALAHDADGLFASPPCGRGSGRSNRRSCRRGCRTPVRRSIRRAAPCAGPRPRPSHAPSRRTCPTSRRRRWRRHAMSTLRCLKMRFSVRSDSRSSTTLRNGSHQASMSLTSLVRQVLMHAADAEVVRVETRARGALVEHHQLLALLEAPERRRERADVERLGS